MKNLIIAALMLLPVTANAQDGHAQCREYLEGYGVREMAVAKCGVPQANAETNRAVTMCSHLLGKDQTLAAIGRGAAIFKDSVQRAGQTKVCSVAKTLE